jgi:hypothetical protein
MFREECQLNSSTFLNLKKKNSSAELKPTSNVAIAPVDKKSNEQQLKLIYHQK